MRSSVNEFDPLRPHKFVSRFLKNLPYIRTLVQSNMIKTKQPTCKRKDTHIFISVSRHFLPLNDYNMTYI